MGSVMMGTMAQQINQGIAKHKQNVERSRGMLENMLPIPESDLTNMWNIAQLLADSDPTAEQTWRIELAIFRAIGKAHWRQWDMKTNAKGRVDLGSFFQDATARGQVWWARYILRLYGTMGHKVKAVYHDSVTGETLSPLYFYIKGTYPSLALATTGSEQINGTDKTYRMRLQDILFNFRLVQNTSLTVAARYHSPQYIAEVFTAAGLTASENDCMALMNAIGFKWTWKRGVKFSGRGIAQDTLGIDLHSVHNVDMGNGVNKQGLIIALIACFTSFHGHIGWTWLNHVLIQGAWPWLGGYNKSYAKTVFTAMVCMFCCVRHGYVWSGAGPVVLRLAGKLVDPECFGTGRLRLRGTGSLGGEKVLYEPVPKTNETEEGEAPAVSEGAEKVCTDAEGVAGTKNPSPPVWTPSTPEPEPSSQPLPPCRHIVGGPPCNHGAELRFTGRIALVTSLSELQTSCDDPNTKPVVIVTKTFDNAHGQLEAEMFLRHQRILSVRRGEKQCVSCAVRLAHLIGAVAVIA